MHRFRPLLAGLTAALLVLPLIASCGEKRSASSDLAPADVPKEAFEDLDFAGLSDDFPTAIRQIRASQRWSARDKAFPDGGPGKKDPRKSMKLKMNRTLLEEAFAAGSSFIVRWQLPEGNFRYMFDWLDGTWVEDDHQVRQAGSLWGIATCYRYRPAPELKAALDKGLAFWFENTVPGPVEGALNLKYPGARKIDSGSLALVSLALVEYLKSDAPMEKAYRQELDTKLDGYLAMLQYMQLDNGHISKAYRHNKKKRQTHSSPYYDGESLLAMSKAARQLGKKELVPTIERAARAMAETYTLRSWPKDRDSNKTKGFFQWGSMAFAEYYQAKWKDYEVYGDVAISLGYWMVHTHATLKRRRNHAYAIEGLIAGWRVANMRGDVQAQTDLLYTLDRSLYKLSGWQIGGPLAKTNSYLVKNGTDDPMAQGGVMNARKPSKAPVKKDVSHQLRIDVTQHQMHAVTMSLDHVYKK